MNKEDCFAFDNLNKECFALKELKCANCNFYKNKKQVDMLEYLTFIRKLKEKEEYKRKRREKRKKVQKNE